jgi:hypothetical protein
LKAWSFERKFPEVHRTPLTFSIAVHKNTRPFSPAFSRHFLVGATWYTTLGGMLAFLVLHDRNEVIMLFTTQNTSAVTMAGLVSPSSEASKHVFCQCSSDFGC